VLSATALVTFGIPVLAGVVATTVVLAVWRTSGPRVAARIGLGVVAWLAFSGTLAASGFFLDWEARPPRAPLLLLPTLLLPLTLGLSDVGRRLAEQTPTWALVGFQAFRLPLELVMHRAAQEGVMPVQMSFEGLNFDIVTGVAAIVGALVLRLRPSRSVAIGFSVVGITLLLAIIGIAVASLPLFGVFGREPERLNTWVGHFPFVWLPAGLVSAATLGHVVLLRHLRLGDGSARIALDEGR
jgi:hypothetical protein